MCLSCGCGEPHNDHGDPNNITFEDLRAAAEAGDVSVEEAADNITAGLAHV